MHDRVDNAAAARVANILFYLFLIFLLSALVMGIVRRGTIAFVPS